MARLAANWRIDGTLIACAHGQIVGEVRIDASWMGFGEIGMMVAADWRGRGVGTALVAAAVEWARAHGLHKLALSVFPHNDAAIALYRKFGFVAEGRLVRRVRRRRSALGPDRNGPAARRGLIGLVTVPARKVTLERERRVR